MLEHRLSRRSLGRLVGKLAASSLLVSAGAAHATAPRGALPQLKAALFPFASAPFPSHGSRPDDGSEFMDVDDGDRRGHTSPRGGIYYEDQTYNDNRVLAALPAGFDLRKKAAIVVFFHGNNATLQRDVVDRQRVLDQVQNSGFNAALIAPQFAVNALDSSAGRFWRPGAFAQFMSEASIALSNLWGSRNARSTFQGLPIILVAYSGGYDPAAYVLSVGGENKRIRGVILLDALVAEGDKFANWIAHNRRGAFFFSAFSEAAAGGNAAVERWLAANGISYSTGLPSSLSAGDVTFLPSADSDHDGFMTEAWVSEPLQWLLSRIPGYPR
jgi:hypothetical protein